MQIVINIDKDDFEEICILARMDENTRTPFGRIKKAIFHGTPLPKGHGDLIDRSKIYKAIPAEEDNCTGMGMTLEEMNAYNEGIDAMYSFVKGAPTIIEADRREE